MTPYQINSYLLRHFEADLHEIADPGDGAILNPRSRALTVCVLVAGAGATTRILADPDDLPFDQEIMLIATGITGANTITIQGRQGTDPTHVFTENGTAIFRVSQEGATKIWFLVANGAMDATFMVSATDRLLGRVSPGAGPVEEVVISDFVQTLLDDADASSFRASIGAGTGNGTIGGTTGASDNSVLRADGTGGSTLQSSSIFISDAGWISADGGDGGLTVDANDVVYAKSENGEPTLVILNPDGTDGGFHFGASGNGTTTATGNIFIGFTSGAGITTGTNNVGVGPRALAANANGGNNVAVGDDALFANTSGGNNVAIGSDTLSFNTIGSGNVAIGPDALFFNIDGISNVAVGEDSLEDNTSGSNNTAVGEDSLANVNTGSRNIGIGSNAGDNITSGSDNIVIGLGDVPSATSNFQLNIGDLLFSPDMTAGSVEIRRGITPTSLSTFNTFTNASNYERLRLSWASNVATIGTEAAGTGTLRGLKLGGAATSLLGFWDATPIVQPAAANQAALTNSTGGTYDGTLAAVSGTGADATINNNFTDLHTLLNEIRTALVNSGLIKGAA